MLEETTVHKEETPEKTPLSEETDQPSEEESTDTEDSLEEQLAAKTEELEKAEEETKRWKNRVKEENPPKKKESKEVSTDEYTEWRIDNKDRIALVREDYDKELEELQSEGAKLTLSTREKALKLAESSVGVKTQEKEEPIPSGTVDRGGQTAPVLTDTDRAFSVNPDIKKKYAHLESTW